jgi:hypothetical protein
MSVRPHEEIHMWSGETPYQSGFTPRAGRMILITVATVVFGQAAGCGGGAMTADSGSPSPAGTGGSLGGNGGPTIGGTGGSGSPSTGSSGSPSTRAIGGSGSPSTRATGGSGGSGGAIGGSGGVTGSPAGSAGAASGTEWVTIHNDFFWYDVDGKRINVRSGTLRRFGDLYYWYGAANGLRDQTCYTSPDLVHWTSKGIVLHLTVETNRMDVLYNAGTKTYVMFLKYNGNGANLGIATASAPEGPYTFLHQTLVDGAVMGDMSIYQDDDGQAYLAYVSWAISTNGSHGIYRMSSDFLTLDTRVFYWTRGGREAPHIFKRDGMYYYGTSRTAGIDPTASALAGPWSAPIEVSTPGSMTSFESQCDFVLPFAGTDGTFYMYDGDRWKQSGGSQGDYVWLPLEFDAKGVPSMTYYQDWDFNPNAGTWRPFDPARDLARGKTATASSTNSTNVAANVTKSTTSKDYTATRWESAASDPQWIMVDLGTSMEIDRVILKWHTNYARAFSLEVSTDATTWMAVYNTTKGASYSVTDVTFSNTSARYVRMNGSQRGTQNGYSLFSFMVLHDP